MALVSAWTQLDLPILSVYLRVPVPSQLVAQRGISKRMMVGLSKYFLLFLIVLFCFWQLVTTSVLSVCNMNGAWLALGLWRCP